MNQLSNQHSSTDIVETLVTVEGIKWAVNTFQALKSPGPDDSTTKNSLFQLEPQLFKLRYLKQQHQA
uniref:Uncharacterized protein n=1 Tax=Megaselia scalaris TaxID=36166 RepID=T1GCB7_MEGSC